MPSQTRQLLPAEPLPDKLILICLLCPPPLEGEDAAAMGGSAAPCKMR